MRRLALVLTVVAIAGCGDDDGAAGAPDAFVPDPIDAGCVPGPDGAPIGTSADDVSGTWAVLQLNTAVVTALNSTQIARNVYLYEITQAGADLTINELTCEIKVDDIDGLVRTRMLPGLAASIPQLTRMGTLNGTAFADEQAWTTRGITLANIETDVMPTDETDPRIGDWDMDNHPGITLLLDGVLRGQAYVIQRDWNQHTGETKGTERIEGLVAWDGEQIYLDSDPIAIADLNAVATPDPDPNAHTFLMVRIPAGSDCSYVRANQCTLFNGK